MTTVHEIRMGSHSRPTSACCALQSAASYSELMTLMSATSLRDRLPSVWDELARCKRTYYSSLSHYNIALALLELSSVADTQLRGRLVHVLINAHSRVAAAAADSLRRPVYSDAAVETSHARLLLGDCTPCFSCLLDP